MSRRHRRSGTPQSAQSRGATPSHEGYLGDLDTEIDGASRGGSRGPGTHRRRLATRRSGKPRWTKRRKLLTALGILAILCLVTAGSAYGYLRYRFDQLPKLDLSALKSVGSGQPFNMLVIGSDSRVGLTPAEQAQAGTAAQVAGQRSDVVMIWHIVPRTRQVTIMSIPRDTMVQMDGDQSEFGQFNRINSSFNSGANLLVETIEDNFGIPINHVIEVDFGGFEGAVNALGGVWMDFPYPAKDAYSGLAITHSGCQLLNGTEALAVARSRHYYYFDDGQWLYDGTSDFGRIQRQDAFLRALIDTAKSKLNPLTVNAFIGSLPQGVVIDNRFGLDDLIGLAEDFRNISTSALSTLTLPTLSVGDVSPWGDVLFVDQPAAQQMLTSIYRSELSAPKTPPPNTALEPSPPPKVSTTAVSSSNAKNHSAAPASRTPTLSPQAPPSFDPTACTPG